MKGGNKAASGLEETATVKRTLAKAQSFEHGRLAHSVHESRPVRYDLRHYLGDLADFMEFKRKSRPSPIL